MPLLKRKAFEKSTVSEYLRDDDEVFHCEVTDEIFKDYEEYCERIILVNSMVWSCEMTGKNNLTYAEALDSEKHARRSLKDFPMELRVPILFLATKTMRSSFAEMSEDVFNFVREKYFIGETVEACLEGDSWHESHVLSVITPKQQPGCNTATIPSSSYCYEVEQFTSNSSGQIATVPHDRVRRRKGVYSRDKNRLFLKQFVQQGPGGIITIKSAALERYNISKVNFGQLFTGSEPQFPSSKKFIKASLSPPTSRGPKPGSTTKGRKPAPDKRGQTSMDTFVKKTDKPDATARTKVNEASKKSAEAFAEALRSAGEREKQKKLEEKERQKENNARLQAYIKEWQRVKDDLELEDHKMIPKGTPIELEGIPQAHIGDFLSVLEFVHLYAETLKAKDVFHNGLDVDMFRKALTLKEHAGVFSDLVQMLLSTIFNLQEDEAEEFKENGGIVHSPEDVVGDGEQEMGVSKAVELATKACKWSQTYLGTQIRKLPLDPTTVSEVLRIHLLSSGAEAGSRCALWRYQQRGGYTCTDDAGLWLRRSHPSLLRRLHSQHVADLPLDDKFRVLHCLMNQILSYATVRDIIEEKLETLRATKYEMRTLQIALRKHDPDHATVRNKLRKEYAARKEELKLTGAEARAHDEQLKLAIEKLNKESVVKRQELERKIKQLQVQCFDYLSHLGSDRGYRHYWLNQCVSGVFVETPAECVGPCLEKPVLHAQQTHAQDTLTYVRTLFENERGKPLSSSDKENDSAANSRGNSPKKPLANLNGLTQKLNNYEDNTQLMRDLFICTANVSTCLVHGQEGRPQWTVYNTEEQINELIESLNKRGLRESELRHNLETDKSSIVDYIKKCPIHMLNPLFTVPQGPHSLRHRKFQPSLTVLPDCSLSEALELSLRDHILELEEKVFHGCLGALKVKDREAWRGTIMLRGYDKQADYLTWGPNNQCCDDDAVLINGQLNHEEKPPMKPLKKYRDPGFYLNENKVNGISHKSHEEDKSPSRAVVRGLASALLQVSKSIHHKYLKRPLGLDDKERKEREARGRPLDLEALERWEVSLMESRSYAQIAIHLFTLDSSITWSASILNASCRICRRKADPDNMLLCDNCNKGHHLYCLKPKLHKVPDGDWFCDQCKPKERTPRKRRKLFSDQDIEDAMRSDSDESLGGRSEGSDAEDIDAGVCAACGSGGRLGCQCTRCHRLWHNECANTRHRSKHKHWTCAQCLAGDTRELSTRRCAVTAINNIHLYTKQISHRLSSSDSYDTDDNVTLVKLKGQRSRKSKESSPQVNGHANGHDTSRRKSNRKSKEQHSPKSRKSKSSANNTPLLNNGHNASKRKRSSRHEVLLHTELLQELLRDVMKHKDSWPFNEPVSQDEVPDYFEVIKEPIDFSTIKERLDGGDYATDAKFMRDAGLVFSNCYTYNKETHFVAKAGVRLQKYFKKRCVELQLPAFDVNPDDFHNDGDDDDEDDNDSDHEPLAKRFRR